jgi:hypothetical protein
MTENKKEKTIRMHLSLIMQHLLSSYAIALPSQAAVWFVTRATTVLRKRWKPVGRACPDRRRHAPGGNREFLVVRGSRVVLSSCGVAQILDIGICLHQPRHVDDQLFRVRVGRQQSPKVPKTRCADLRDRVRARARRNRGHAGPEECAGQGTLLGDRSNGARTLHIRRLRLAKRARDTSAVNKRALHARMGDQEI